MLNVLWMSMNLPGDELIKIHKRNRIISDKTANEKMTYDITLFPNTLSPWFSQVYAGLYDLQRAGKADISLSTRFKYPQLVDATSLAIEVKEKATDRTLRILVDLNDNRNLSVPSVTDWFDVIVKRSFHPPTLEKLPEKARNKIIPYGLNFNCGSRAMPVMTLFLNHQLVRLKNLGKLNLKKHKFVFQHQLRFLFYLFKNNLSLHEDDFMGTPGGLTKNRIFFITRLFSRGNDLTEFSYNRIELLKKLKKEFGDSFLGGVVRNSLSEKYCPRDLLCEKVSRREYTTMLRESDIAICTLGVGESNPWKLGEAVAGARCIVTEPLRFKLPNDLEEGVHVKTFVTNDECVQACAELLEQPELVRQMKENTQDYYEQYVRSDRLVERFLVESLLRY
ncbi:MAG: glycosyltransferase [Gammaproteobacteria bacterium]